MSSKFGRTMRHRKTPGVCRAPRPPGPVDDGWPPRTATGLCKWEGTQAPYGDFLVQGLCQLVWHPIPREYRANVLTGKDMVEIRCTLAFGNNWFNTYYNYWMDGHYLRAAYSYHHEAVQDQPILLTADFKVRPDYIHHVVFKLSAFPLL